MGNFEYPVDLLAETGAPGENTRKHRETMKTPHIKAGLPSCFEATALTSAPPHHTSFRMLGLGVMINLTVEDILQQST